MPLDPNTLELFVRVATLGAFGKAGRESGLSPTAATRRIKGLEAEFGLKLFNRRTRAVALTADGEVFLGHAKRIIANLEDARSDLSGGSTNIKGELRVAGSASFGRRYMAPYIAEFLCTYPQVRVRLELSDGIVDIVERGFDLVLRIGSLTSSSFEPRRARHGEGFGMRTGSVTWQHGATLLPGRELSTDQSWWLRRWGTNL